MPEELDPHSSHRLVAFQNFVIYLMLSSHSNEKVDLLQIVQAKYARELDIPATEVLAKFLKRFLAAELLPFEAGAVEASVAGFEPFRIETEHAANHL